MIYSAGVRSATTLQSPIINLGQNDSVDMFILNLDIGHNYTDFSAPGQVTLCGFGRIMPATGTVFDRNETIKSGDLIDIFESGDGVNFVPLFSGYVVTTNYRYEKSTELFILNVDTRLAQWKTQMMIQTFGELKTLGPGVTGVDNTDFNSNKVKFDDLIQFMIDTSVFDYVKKYHDFKTIYQQPNVNKLLNKDSIVWYYASTGSTKESVLLATLYSYQVMCWQNQEGNIVFTAPSELDKSTFNLSKGDPILRGFEVVNAQAATINNQVVSLLYLGFFPDTTADYDKNVASQSIPDAKYFPQSNALYKTGYFNQTALGNRSIQTNMMTDPQLLNLLATVNYLVPDNANKTATIVGLLSARYLAAALTSSKYVEIEIERTPQTSEIPVGKVINIDNESYFCIRSEVHQTASVNDTTGTSLSNTMTLTGVPLRSITGYWYTG